MQKSFDYLETRRFESSIDIDDIGNCYLVAYNDGGESYYLSISTSLGFSTITQFGSLNCRLEDCKGDDIPQPSENYFSYEKFKVEYKEAVISKIIYKWIRQDDKTQIFEVDGDTFYNIISKLRF